MIIPLVLLGLIALVTIPTKLAQWHASHQPAERTSGAGALLRDRRPRVPQLPEGHRPPPGLGPLSPSERFLTAESTRGLRDLELFLHNPA